VEGVGRGGRRHAVMTEMGLCSTGANDEGGGEAHCNDGRGQISSGQKMEGMRHAVMT